MPENEQLYNLARKILSNDEGVRDHAYPDEKGKLTIGIGHNLTDNGISKATIDQMFCEDYSIALTTARKLHPDFDGWKVGRRLAILSMIFNLGELRYKKFVKMRAAIAFGKWEQAAAEALDSKWREDVKEGRANRIAYMIRTGDVSPEYTL